MRTIGVFKCPYIMLGLVRRPFISILLLLASVAAFAVAQDSPDAAAPPHAQVFSGYVTEITPHSISVSRKSSTGKEMVHKSFGMDGKTKVEGKIKLNARVTVQFLALTDSNYAQRIIVRGT
jgi:hypothetical protein